ncbi:Formyl-CoA transferase [Variovorax sp. WDL1]|nr:Formyl-CoA transferase [Variovorax sp. WDL1]
MNLNRNKRSIALDLKSKKALEVMRKLIATADVFLHNMRPIAIARLGLGYEEVCGIKADIIYAEGVGFGQSGPYRDKPAFDDVVQAASGLVDMFVKRDGRPSYVPTAIADKVTGLHLSQAVVAALLHRVRTGEGQKVEVPMFETLVAFNLVEHMSGGVFEPPGEVGYKRLLEASRRPFRTRDGYISILPYTDPQWLRFFAAIGRPQLMDDPLYATYRARIENAEPLYQFVASITPEKSASEWMDICVSNDIPCMPILTLGQLARDVHLRAVGMFEDHLHPVAGCTHLVRSPMLFSKSPASIRRPAPRYGEHTAEIMRELGCGNGEGFVVAQADKS